MTTEKSPSAPWYKTLVVITVLFILLSVMIIRGSKAGNPVDTYPNQPTIESPKVEDVKEKDNIQEQLNSIPGISAVDVYGNLKKIGFTCKGPDLGADGLITFECREETSEHLYVAQILGNSPSEILSVQATALNYSTKSTDDVAKDFFGYIASVPYEGSDQITPKNRVIANISNSTNTVINKVRFTIAGNERSRILTIAPEGSSLD